MILSDHGVEDHAVDYDIIVTSDSIYDKHDLWWRTHDCTVYVDPSEHESTHTWKIFSWAFSNGVIRHGNINLNLRNKALNTPFLNFLQQHPNLFPILQKVLLLQR